MKEEQTTVSDGGPAAIVPSSVKTSTGQVNINGNCDGHLTLNNNTNGAGRPRLGSDSDDSLKWEEFFGGSLDIAPSLLSMYDKMVVKNGLQNLQEPKKPKAKQFGETQCQPRNKKLGSLKGSQRLKVNSGYISNEKKRPSSISSTSSSGSSVASVPTTCFTMDSKKAPYLTSIESFEFENENSEDEEEEIIVRSKRDSAKNRQMISCNTISAPKPCAGKPKYLDPNLSYIDRVVMEIVETEKTYVSDLLEIITGYMKPITSRSDSTISESLISDLFGNIEDIYMFNSDFLQKLEQCGLNPVKVSQCFVEHNEGFTIYTNYCTNYPRTVSALTEVMRKEESAVIFKDRQACLEHTLPLGSYLLKPVQRILKYHLLLQNLVKHYEKTKDGASDIKKALNTMTGIASHINDMKRKHEHAVRVQEIQSLLYGWIGQDLTTYGELVAEGIFRVYGAKGLRQVFLFDKILIIAKKKEDSTMTYKTHILCSDLMLIESVPGEPLSFHIIPFDKPKCMYTLQARTVDQKREWSLQLKRVILENYNAVIPSHARQLVMELGQSKNEDAYADKYSTRKQHSAPEYLEKRKQERRKSETGLNKALRMKKREKKNSQARNKKRSPSLPRHDQKIKSKLKEKENPLNENSGDISCPSTENLLDADSSIEDQESKGNNKLEASYYSSRESLTPLPTNGSFRNEGKQESEDDCLSSNMSEDNLGDYEILSFSKPNQRQGLMSSEDEDPSGDYVTFDYAQKYLSRENMCASPSTAEYYRYYNKLANYDNLTHVWSEYGAVDVSKLDQTLEVESLSRPKCKQSVRRVQSFNSASSGHNAEKEFHFQHSFSMRQKKRLNNLEVAHSPSQVISHDISSLSRPPSGIDQANSPTAPSVWLKKQGEHLVDATNKSGSLPRSFLANHDLNEFNGICAKKRNDNGKTLENRPITIASDKPEKSDFLDDFEHYMQNVPTSHKRRSNKFPVNEDYEDQRSLGAWTECSDANSDMEIAHPEYKIYRNSNSRLSLRSVLANVSHKLSTGIKNTINGGSSKLTSADQAHSCSNISLQSCESGNNLLATSNNRLSTYSNVSYKEDDENSNHKASHSPRNSAKLVYSIAKVYGTMLKHRLKKAVEAADTSEKQKSKILLQQSEKPRAIMPKTSVNMYRKSREEIGARFANSSDVDYCTLNNKGLKSDLFRPHNELRSTNTLRPDSVLSESSNLTSSSNDSDKQKLTVRNSTEPELPVKNIDEDGNTSDVSGDSYYERSFEAIETMLENDMFRDSAIYSDQEDSDNIMVIQEKIKDSKILKNDIKEVPCKPKISSIDKDCSSINKLVDINKVKGNAILETLENLQRNAVFQKENPIPNQNIQGIKSIVQRQRDLETWKHSIQCQNESSSKIDSGDICKHEEPEESENARMKGWVKHVIGKFQADS